jgi:hypothetical protein
MDDFWNGATPYTEPTELMKAELLGAVSEAAWELAKKISPRLQAAAAAEDAERTMASVALTPSAQLALLRALREVAPAVEVLANRAAVQAGSGGVGYPQLGEAWGITRQSARVKWPRAVMAAGVDGGSKPIKIEAAGGRAVVDVLPDEGGWGWVATGGNGVVRQSDRVHATPGDAAIDVGVFLGANQADPR